MATISPALGDVRDPTNLAYVGGEATRASAVSWAAIFAGAAAAASLSLILLVLGTGLGLSSVSPWAQSGIRASTFGISTILWISFTALAASGLGGYLAGRLRIKWSAVHTDEVYFRDTAHGFLAWAIATLVTAGLLTSAIGSIVNVGTTTASGALAATAGTAGEALQGGMARGGPDRSMPSPYMMDSLFRSAPGPANQPTVASSGAGETNEGPSGSVGAKGEVARIFANSIRTGPLPADDMRYAAQVVAQRTGMSQQDAEKRVTDMYTSAQARLLDAESAAKNAADQAREAAAYASLWIFVSLLLGAFAASLMATIGGRGRDLSLH